MKKKLFVLLSLFCILIVVSFLTIKKVKSVAEPAPEKVEKRKELPVSKEVTSEEKETEPEKKTVFDEAQVVTKEVYPKLELTGDKLNEYTVPVGTVLNVKPVPDNEDWVEIISDPKKGFIEKDILEPREIHIEQREEKRKPTLTQEVFKENLDKDLQEFVKEKGGDISIYAEAVDQSFSYSYNGDKINRTASSIKLPFITYLMTLIDEKKIDLNTQLTYTANFKLDGTGIIQFEPVGGQYSVGKLAELVIRYSDNIAYVMLLNYVGEQEFINYLGRLDSASPNNRAFSSPRILTKAMNYVYTHQDKSKNINTLYNWLQQSIFDDGVAVGLPGVDVAHKTGWMPMYAVSNDIALVKDTKKPYFVTIMTGGYDEAYSEKSIGDIAKIVDSQVLQLK